MKRFNICLLFGLMAGIASAEVPSEDYWKNMGDRVESVPHEYWDFMNGYKYDYKNPDCHIGWHGRSATFLASGQGCENISDERIKDDAMASIRYVKQQGQYEDFFEYYSKLEEEKIVPVVTYAIRRDARLIWLEGCNDSYRRKFLEKSKHVNNEKEIVRSFPELKAELVMRLYRNGWRAPERTIRTFNCDKAVQWAVTDDLILDYSR